MICSLKEGVCVHKNIFPIQGIEIVGTVIITILMALSVMSGVGGGGIVVPLLMFFFEMDTKKAVSISGFTILSGSIVRFIFTFKHKHPKKDATCIEYGLTNVMLPTVLLGSTIGVFMNIILPSIILQFSLALLLVGLCIQSSFKAKQIYDNESVKMSEASDESREENGP